MLRHMKGALSDLADFVARMATGRWNLPPRRLRDVGSGDFAAIGDELLGHFIQLGGLAPSHRVLEIGCGCGRMALPLVGYLRANGTYVGMDVQRAPVEWCARRISRRHKDFRFFHADIYNARYNPAGTLQVGDYTFPFDDAAFDFVILTSVFTHLLPDGFERYVREIVRLLKPRGTLFATFFLLNEAQQAAASARQSEMVFPFAHDVYRVADAAIPETAVAYDEAYVRGYFARFGLKIKEPIAYGTWSGRPQGRSFQDIVVASKSRPVLRSI
jgi:SAM-dependent methyltransferase